MLSWENDFEAACKQSLDQRKPLFIDVMKDP
jgi:hypothetical protein